MRARLAVVVPSALVLIFVLIFLAFGSLRQALLVYSGIPLATVVIGGIISSTLLTLVVLPVLYAWVERWSADNSVVQSHRTPPDSHSG